MRFSSKSPNGLVASLDRNGTYKSSARHSKTTCMISKSIAFGRPTSLPVLKSPKSIARATFISMMTRTLAILSYLCMVSVILVRAISTFLGKHHKTCTLAISWKWCCQLRPWNRFLFIRIRIQVGSMSKTLFHKMNFSSRAIMKQMQKLLLHGCRNVLVRPTLRAHLIFSFS